MDNSFKTKIVANTKIKVSKHKSSQVPVKGSDWMSEPYANIFLLAKKQLGKTTVIENMLPHFAGKNTKFIFIVSTINKDKTWINIVKYWEKKGNDVITYDDLYEDGVNVLEEFTESEQGEPQVGGSSVVTEIKKIQLPNLYNGAVRYQIVTEQKEVKENIGRGKKVKMLYPEYIIVLDDLGANMRNKGLTQLLKTNRHYKAKVIMSAQNMTDLEPAAINQLDYTLVFGQVPDERIERLRKQLDLKIDEKDFLELYKDATKDQYQFLYISRVNGKDTYRKGFNEQYE